MRLLPAVRKYRSDYNNNPNAISFMPVASTSGRIHSEFIRILFFDYRVIGKLTVFCNFRSSVSAFKYGNILPLSPRGFLFDA
jgi:hypothetical protein